MLAVMLIGGIVSLIDSIPLSIRTIYRYSEHYLGITPRGDPTLTPEIGRRVRAGSPVPIDRIMVCRASEAQVQSIVGKWPFVVLALSPSDMGFYLRRMGALEVDGRLPESDKPEAVVSEPVARNLGLKLGSVLLGPDQAESYSPLPVKVVGIAQTSQWIMLAPLAYHQKHHFPPIDILLVFAKSLKDQRILDDWALAEFKGDRARVFAYSQLDRETSEMFRILYRILNVVIAVLVLVITFMMAMLMNIYQSQRLQEFGLLQALGYTRRQMLQRVLSESALVVVLGWALGLLAALAMLLAVDQTLMHPQAFALEKANWGAFRYTLLVPLAIFAAAALTLMFRFRRFDPVGVVERRLV